jgi:hypothetical protein
VPLFRRGSAQASSARPQDEIAALRASLAALHTRVLASGHDLPDGATPQFRRIEDALLTVLDHPSTAQGSPEQMFLLTALITDYVPTSVDTYLALPPQLSFWRRAPGSDEAAMELRRQLELLEDRCWELAAAVTEGNVQALKNQSRFLEGRFGTSSLKI